MENALETAVREIERHAAAAGWDGLPALYALVRTADLVRDEPELAGRLGLDGASAGDLTPVAQEELTLDPSVPDVLAGIEWPDVVVGAVVTLETITVPDHVEDGAPAGAASGVVQRPNRQEGRLVVGVLRDGSRAGALRWRSHDAEDDVVIGPDLAPGLADALASSLRPSAGGEGGAAGG